MKTKYFKFVKSKAFAVVICIIAIYTVWYIYNANCDFYTPHYKYSKISRSDGGDIVFELTGLSPKAFEEMKASGDFETIKTLNKMYFEKPEYKKYYIAYPVTAEEKNLNQNTPLAPLKDGDILVTFNTHTFSWRHGHLAIVTDAQNGIILEHMAIGQTSCFSRAKKWGEYPAFALLRYPDEKKAKQAAEYAKEHLIDVPYNILAGVITKDKSAMNKVDSSQCSHIVWQAYKAVGADIDKNGGLVVTPKDVAFCNELKVVQIYGLNPKNYKDRLLK